MLLSIALNSVSKFQVRVLPTILEHKEKFGNYPEGLVMSMAALIAFYRTDKANDGAEIMEFMKTASVGYHEERGLLACRSDRSVTG